MAGVDVRRILTCGLFAGLVWSFLSVPLLVFGGGQIFEAVSWPIVTGTRSASVVLNVVAGVWVVWLYVNLRPRYGAGVRSSAIAGFSWWLMASISSWQWSDLGFIRQRDLVNLMALSLPLLVAVTMIAAWSYERAARQTVARARESLQ